MAFQQLVVSLLSALFCVDIGKELLFNTLENDTALYLNWRVYF